MSSANEVPSRNSRITEMKSCIFYAQGRCKKGNSCNFLHDLHPIPAPPTVPDIACLTTKNSDSQRALLSGKFSTPYETVECEKYSSEEKHHLSSLPLTGVPANPLPETTAQPPRDSRALVACKYYLQGNCQYGNDCVYAHSTETGRKKSDQAVDSVSGGDLFTIPTEVLDIHRMKPISKTFLANLPGHLCNSKKERRSRRLHCLWISPLSASTVCP